MKIGLVVPHIFMHRAVLPHVIFSPAKLAIDLAEGLSQRGAEVTLFSPGPVDTTVPNITADLSYFENELKLRGDTYTELLKKHPFTFVTLARQVQSELIAKAYNMANQGEFDIVHIYTNEEDTALPFAALCRKPVMFTHHDPFNFLIKYKNVFPKYVHVPWLSTSLAQRKSMQVDTNWAGNIYHGINDEALQPSTKPHDNYIAYIGRIIQPKGVHVAIKAVQNYNKTHPDDKMRLKIAGKHYAGHKKDTYWQGQVLPHIDGDIVEYVGFIDNSANKQALLGNAKALMVPSLFEEPFGLVAIEALACGTPVIGLNSGALPEIISGKVGIIAKKVFTDDQIDDEKTADNLADAIARIGTTDRRLCRQEYLARFTLDRMISDHLDAYERVIQSPDRS